MKKIIGLLFLAILLHSCDDGSLQLKTFNFNNEAVTECDSLYYIINGKEMMILKLDKPETLFLQEPTADNKPIIYTLTNKDQLLYRLYSENVNASAICSKIPPATPTVVSEYIASTGGQIEITTNVNINVNSTTKSTTINYTHQIKLINCNFSSGTNSLVYTNFIFGNYKSQSNTMSYSFGITPSESSCTATKAYKNNTNQVLMLDFTTNFPTTTGSFTIPLGSNNKIISRLYTGESLNNTNICTPSLKLKLLEEWTATEGTVQISTTRADKNGVSYLEHNITLLDCNYTKGNLNYLHNKYEFGVYSVPE